MALGQAFTQVAMWDLDGRFQVLFRQGLEDDDPIPRFRNFGQTA